MDSHEQIQNTLSQVQFVKGMTLEQYMGQANFKELEESDCKIEEELGEDLYQSSRNKELVTARRKMEKYEIREIDEESYEQSISESQEHRKEQKLVQKTKQTNYQFQKQTPAFNTRINAHAVMNATAYLPRNSNEKINSFRIKHKSNSPYKKEKEKDKEVPNFAMTLHGSNHFMGLKKPTKNMEQIMTVYGKFPQMDGRRKEEGQKNFKKKSSLNLQELIEFQKKIKSNYSHKFSINGVKVDTGRERLLDRKSKLK